MTETEIRKAMHEAGEKILPILRNFENKTGQRIESIRFQRTNKAATGLEIINYVDVFTRDYP